MDHPSSLPSGYRLTKEIVETFCLPGTWITLTSLLRKANFIDSVGNIKIVPRLEAILGNIVSVLGYSILRRFYSLNPAPNYLHFFFAQHIASKGKHITLNLDQGIENAIKYSFNDILSPWILHLHGKFGDMPSELGLTFENIAKGLSSITKQKTLEAILGADTIIFTGYSGSDVFDINPFFKSLVGLHDLSKKTAIWLDHCESSSSEVKLYTQSKKKLVIMDALSNCGAKTYVWKGLTNNFISELIKIWNFSTCTLQPSIERSTPSFDKDILNWQKQLITAKLYISMGLGAEALVALHDQCRLDLAYREYCKGQQELEEMTPTNKILYIRNEAYRELGRYGQSLKISAQLVPHTDLDIMLSYERKASDYWLAGAWITAKKEFLEALKYGSTRLGNSHQFDTIYLEAIRAYMQLCRDIGRLPIVGKHLFKKNISYPIELINNNEYLQKLLRTNPYDRSHIARLFAWEKHTLESNTEKLPTFLLDEISIIEPFGETDNILGIINTTRSKLQLRLSRGQIVHKKDVLRLLALSRAIGDRAGIVKACRLLAEVGGCSKRTIVMFFSSLVGVQWVYGRKCYEAIQFLSSIGCRHRYFL